MSDFAFGWGALALVGHESHQIRVENSEMGSW